MIQLKKSFKNTSSSKQTHPLKTNSLDSELSKLESNTAKKENFVEELLEITHVEPEFGIQRAVSLVEVPAGESPAHVVKKSFKIGRGLDSNAGFDINKLGKAWERRGNEYRPKKKL
jgi:hypothetical protein